MRLKNTHQDNLSRHRKRNERTIRRVASRKRSRSKTSNTISGIIIAVFLVILAVLLNDLFFHFEGIPTVSELIAQQEPEETEATTTAATEKEISYVDNNISVHYIDVGQGDCQLIITKNYSMLIDCGEKEYWETVAAYIKNLGIEKLDYVMVSHPHSDHAGGMSYIVDEFDVCEVLMPKLQTSVVPTTKTYTRLLDSIDSKGIKVTYPRQGSKITMDDCVITFFAPVTDYEDLNNYSICFKLTHFNNSFLFTGDIEKEAEADILASGADLSANVLKVAHHGSSTSSTTEFLTAVGADYAVLEVGDGNSYNHPNQGTLERLKAARVSEILRTDYNGNIVFWSDGVSVGYNCDKYEEDAA